MAVKLPQFLMVKLPINYSNFTKQHALEKVESSKMSHLECYFWRLSQTIPLISVTIVPVPVLMLAESRVMQDNELKAMEV